MEFFTSAIDILQTLVVALGAGFGVWGIINLLEGYGNDNPGRERSRFLTEQTRVQQYQHIDSLWFYTIRERTPIEWCPFRVHLSSER
jgi:hypothetical protein